MEASDGPWRSQHVPTGRPTGPRVIDVTDASVADRICAHAAAFPTDPVVAVAIMDAYLRTGAVTGAIEATAAGPMRTRQVLHRCGIEDACRLAPSAKRWLEAAVAGTVGLAAAQQQAGLDTGAFILGVYCLTHPPIAEVAAVVRRERYRIS